MPMRVGGLIQTIGPPPPLAGDEPKEPGPELDAWRMRMKAVDDWRNSALDHGFDPQTILSAQGITGEHGGGGWSWMNNLRAQAQYGKAYNSMYQYDWVNGRKRQMIPRNSEDVANRGGYRDWEPISANERDSKSRADYLRQNTDQADFERLMYHINPGEGFSLLGSDAAGDFGYGAGNRNDPGKNYLAQWNENGINPWTAPLNELYNTPIHNVSQGAGGSGGYSGGGVSGGGNGVSSTGVLGDPGSWQSGNYSALTGQPAAPAGTSYAQSLNYKDPKAQNTNVAGYTPGSTPYGGGIVGQNSLYGQEYGGGNSAQQQAPTGQQYAKPLGPNDPRTKKINPLTGQPTVGY